MIEITKYVALDGAEFDNMDDCLDRDAVVTKCDNKVRQLGMKDTPNTVEFFNGGGFVQQPKGTKIVLTDWLRSRGASLESSGPLRRLVLRVRRTDDDDREWGHFALNPPEGAEKLS